MNYKKKKSRKNIIIASCAVVVFAIATFLLVNLTGNNKGYRTISVVDISGTVSVVKDGIEYSAYPGMILQEGHEIVTAANSYVRMVLDDDKYVKLESGSRLVFETLGLLGSNKTRLNLERGSLTSEIVKPLESDAQYVVVAPNAVLSVRGTFFRVDLNMAEDGNIQADVMTYGGQVASQRIMPTGDVVEEEVLIDAGFKASINMDVDDTVYMMQTVDGSVDTTGDGVANLAPIMVTDIPDDDMVDIFFAAENGHELFVSAEEAKEDIEVRGINLEEKTSVYALAETIKAEEDKTVNLAGRDVIADDSKPLARVEETVEEEEVSEVTSETKIQNVVSVLTDGDGQESQEISEEPHVHVEVAGGTKDEHSKCSECGEVLSVAHTFTKEETKAATCENVGENTYTCSCGYSYTEEIEVLGHSAVAGGVAEYHEYCANCGMVISDNTAHTFTEEIVKVANCTENGEKKYTCSCGYSYTEEIEATGHSAVSGATACQTVCSTCGITLSTSHSYTSSVTTEATCTTAGVKTYTCGCGYSYTEEIEATGHTETTGGVADCHVKCSVCGATITDGSGHSYTESVTTQATCTTAGVKTYTCGCGYSYTEEIEATGHTEVAGATADCHVKCSVCKATITDGSGHSYTESITTEASCITAGVRTYTCGCGYSYTEEIEATGHTETTGGTETCHSKCSVCQATIEDGSNHEFTSEVTTEAGCTTAGVRTYTCGCGYSYTEEIEATGHTETTGGTETCHSKCSVCNETLSSNHSYTDTVTKEANCEEVGETLHSCECGYEYTSEIAALGHDYATEFTVDTEMTCTAAGSQSRHCSRCDATTDVTEIPAAHEAVGEGLTTCKHCAQDMLELTAANFPDETFLKYVKDTFNTTTTDDTILIGTELTALTTCTTIDVKGTSSADGGITDLTGIEYFTALTTLDCSYNSGITTVDLSACNALNTVNMTGCTGLTSFDITGCTAVTSLDLSQCTNLTTLNVSGSGLTTLDTSACTKLTDLTVTNCASMTTVNASGCTALTNLTLSSDVLTTLNVSGCTSLTTLDTASLPALTNLNISGSGLETVDVAANTALTTLTAQNCTALVSINSEQTAQETHALKTVDVSGSTALQTLNVRYCDAITSLNATGCTALEYLDVGYCDNLVTFNGATGTLNLSEHPNLVTIKANWLNGFSAVNLASNTKLEFFHLSANSTIKSLDFSNCTNLKTLLLGGITALTSLSINECTLLEEVVCSNTQITAMSFTHCPNLASLGVDSNTALTSLDVSGCTALTSLNVSSCSALTTLDIRTLENLEVFNASNSGIKTLSGSTTTLDFSYNKKLKDIRLNALTSFSTINLTENKALERFVYNAMPMTSIDLSNCVALQNFQIGGSAVTSLDFSNCPEIYRIINQTSSALTSLNVNGCTKLFDVRLASSNNLASVDLTGAGTEAELGAYLEGKYLVFTVTSGSTTETTLQNAAGWDASIMSITN